MCTSGFWKLFYDCTSSFQENRQELVNFFRKLFENRIFNPFSHCLFSVFRLTAICHMRHPLKADLGKKWRQFLCPCVGPSARTSPTRLIQTEQKRLHSTFFTTILPVCVWFQFRKDLQNPQSMLIPNLFVYFKFSLLKASKAVKTTFGPVCVCERQPFLPVRQSLEKKFSLLKELLLKSDWNLFLMMWSWLPGYHELADVCKTAVQGLVDKVIMKLL
jgi:hypothetical protein